MNVNKSPFADFSFSLFCFRDFLYFLLLLLLLLLLGWTFTSFVLLCFALRQFGVKKENVTIENIGEIMLCQVPGISTTISKVIINKYKTIKDLLQTIDKWFKIKNFKEENILTKFYEDPAKYSFSFQIMVLKT